MIFADRREAGHRLGERLIGSAGPSTVVLGIARGGVVVAAEVARMLSTPLDVVVPRKISAPLNSELAIGAVAPGVTVLDEHLIGSLNVSDDYLSGEIRRQEEEIERRTRLYRAGSEALDVRGRLTLLVDDGVATGSTAVAAIRWAKQNGSSEVLFAVPVGPPGSRERLSSEADQVVVLATPDDFFAVGQFYFEFSQTTDEEVMASLAAVASAIEPRS